MSGWLTFGHTCSAAMGATTCAPWHPPEDAGSPAHHRLRPSAQLLRCVSRTLPFWYAHSDSTLTRGARLKALVRACAGICYMQVPTDTMDTLDCCKARFCRCAALCTSPWSACQGSGLLGWGCDCGCLGVGCIRAGLKGKGKTCAGRACYSIFRTGCRTGRIPSSARTTAPAKM